MKNITLSADEGLIEAARLRALSEQTTLNAMFRVWLEEYVQRQQQESDVRNLIGELRAKYVVGNQKFSRDEMNERR
jgi:hypothetical protein